MDGRQKMMEYAELRTCAIYVFFISKKPFTLSHSPRFLVKIRGLKCEGLIFQPFTLKPAWRWPPEPGRSGKRWKAITFKKSPVINRHPPNNQIVLNKQVILGKVGVKAWEAVWRLENAKPSHLSNWLSGVSAQMWRSECFFRDKITYIESFRLRKTVQVKGWEGFISFTLFCITSIHTPSFRPVVIIGEVRLTTRRLFRTTRRVGKTNQGVVRTSRRVVKPCAPYS